MHPHQPVSLPELSFDTLFLRLGNISGWSCHHLCLHALRYLAPVQERSQPPKVLQVGDFLYVHLVSETLR